MKLASFDIELATPLPEGSRDLDALEISCAAVAFGDRENIEVFEGDPALSRSQSQELLDLLGTIASEGYGIATWNGCAFDFPVLAHSAGQLPRSARLALSHHDLMLYVTFQKGWYLGLQKALAGAGLAGKLKEIRLSGGTLVTNMDGSKAPQLWADGEREAVIAYLEQDVRQQLSLATWIAEHEKICWTSSSGNPWNLQIPKLYTVEECFDFLQPDVSWMDNPPEREQFVEWMPQPLQPG
ncbi:ribonuclease H-like domain-containing protein [Aliifodinibius sp. S!AR15-10]|uniref:ribonuclease H-like domain-containing protein n=1 Tax=Aliifodinibius sp. S!AR15-10 TaxID=2950437 RepID=UPI002855DAB8|nr:ribonuclease H-like domain-containing protein [Aliifodinibius sp. S!AR15-10]MDR8391145.1 ribonuclease H-like domain-containing protein [Aliifodinibius sp. S!AR15-10]